MPALTAQVGHTFKACHFGRLYFFWSSLMVKQLTCSVALSLVMLLTGTGAALAHSEKQDHDAHWAKRPPVISLQSEAVTEVQQDKVTIFLATEFNEATQAEVDQQLRKVVDSVIAEAKQQEVVNVSSSHYRVYPTSDRKGAISGWRGQAEIKLESTDIQAAGELATQLSDRMAVSRLYFSVSPEARAQYEKELLSDAIDNFKQRAQVITDNMGFASYQYKEVNVGGSGANYMPVGRSAMMASSDVMSSAPMQEKLALESGTEHISVSVNGSIYLHK